MHWPGDLGPEAINLDQPGSYLNWSIFTVSVANLVLIAVMVAIFGAALLLPFPRGHRVKDITAKAANTAASLLPLDMLDAATRPVALRRRDRRPVVAVRDAEPGA